MTGGGHHRGRVTGRPGGAHWWGGTGRSGGGSHAVRHAGLGRPLMLVALHALLLAGGVVAALVLTRGGEPAPAAASAGPSAQAAPNAPSAPGTAGRPVGAVNTPAPDAAILQSTIDDVLRGAPLRFAADSPTPTDASSASIERLAAVLRATPGPPITVEGHTAPAGEETGSAQQLSQQRADEITRRLEAAGVPTGRLTPVGVGPARPLESLEASRRVEIRVG